MIAFYKEKIFELCKSAHVIITMVCTITIPINAIGTSGEVGSALTPGPRIHGFI